MILDITFLMALLILKNFDSSLLKIDKKSHKSIDTCYIGYITIKKVMKIFIV